MDKKTTDIVAYLTWIGFIIALVSGDKENSKFHLNQALVLNLFALIGSLFRNSDHWYFCRSLVTFRIRMLDNRLNWRYQRRRKGSSASRKNQDPQVISAIVKAADLLCGFLCLCSYCKLFKRCRQFFGV